MRPSWRRLALVPALLASLGLVALGALAAAPLARAGGPMPEVAILALFLGVGLTSAWGLARRDARVLLFAAGAFAAAWVASSCWLLLARPQMAPSELAGTIRQHGAATVLVAGAFVLAARALGGPLGPHGRRVLAAFASLLAFVSVLGFAFGAPGRDIPGATGAVALGAAGALGAWLGARRGDARALLAGAALLLAAAFAGAWWHYALDVDKPVALVSYGGPAGLALLPLVALLLLRARDVAAPTPNH